jgi:putative ABC transport system permease protein
MIVYAWHEVMRNPRRTGTYLFGLALAVGLFAGILFFVDASTRQMTTNAITPVKLDIVAHATSPNIDIARIATMIAQQRGISTTEPLNAADFASATRLNGTQIASAGRLFALAPSYFHSFDILQMSEGSFVPSGAVISEAMAISMKLKVGDTMQLTFAGVAGPIRLPVTGIINPSSADALFSASSEAENNIVSNLVFVDNSWFQEHLQTPLAALASNPPASLPAGAVILDPQIHIKIDRVGLPADPTMAALYTEALRRQIERNFPGQIKATDNLAIRLTGVTGDVLSAKMLFIFLGLPGVALAAYLSKFAAELFAEAQRRELGLLRTRGATPRQITTIVALASILLAIVGSVLGLGVGLIALFIAAQTQGSNTFNPLAPDFDWGLLSNSAAIAFLAGLLLTFLAAFLPALGALRREILQERRVVQRVATVPFWKRTYLDFLCLGAAVVVLGVSQLNGGFKPTGNEGTALSLSFYVFLAPLFAWTGLTLLLLRLIERGLASASTLVAALFRRVFGEVGGVAGKSASLRARQVGAATTVIALTLSFGVSLILFQQTYATQKQLDAQYIVGSDIRLTPPLNTPQTADFATQLLGPGVAGVTAIARDTEARVGSDINTVYGIDIPSFRQVAYLPDSFFVDGTAQQTNDALANGTTNYAQGSAQQVLDALARTPNGVIISVEQAQKYNIRFGDPVLLQLYNRTTKQYTQVQAQTVGFFLYLPTSSQDSDFILNRDFMLQKSGNTSVNHFLIKTDGQAGSVSAVSDALSAKYRNVLPVRIETIETVVKADTTSLTSLNLNGLGAMERLYTIIVTSVGLAVFLLAMINQRRREFGAMRALGANLGHLRRFLFAEASLIAGLSLILGAGIGILLARLLVMLLGIIFTIPPNGLSWPGPELLVMGVSVVTAMLISTLVSAYQLGKLRVVEVLREL